MTNTALTLAAGLTDAKARAEATGYALQTLWRRDPFHAATALAAMKRGREAGMMVILNPAPAPKSGDPIVADLLAAADVVTPNRGEALALAGGVRKGDLPALADYYERLQSRPAYRRHAMISYEALRGSY